MRFLNIYAVLNKGRSGDTGWMTGSGIESRNSALECIF